MANDKDKDSDDRSNTITRTFTLAPATLTSSETARLIAVNTAPAATGNNPAPSCTGSFAFLASGSAPPTVGTPTFTLAAGAFAFLDLPYAKSGLSATPGEVVGIITQTIATGSKAVPCNLHISEVIFDTTTGGAHAVVTSATTAQTSSGK